MSGRLHVRNLSHRDDSQWVPGLGHRCHHLSTVGVDLVQVGWTGVLTDKAMLRVLGPAVDQGSLRVEVYDDKDLSGTITQADLLYTESVLEVGTRDGSSLLTKAQDRPATGFVSKTVQAGRTYLFTHISGLADNYRDVSVPCTNIEKSCGGCTTSGIVTPGGQATLRLLVQRVP